MRRYLILLMLVSIPSCSRSPSTLRFWQFWDLAAVEPLVAEFERTHPGVEVEVEQLTWKSGLEKIQAALAAGDPPDLCELGSTWVPLFSYRGVLADLSALKEQVEKEYLMWEYAVWDGRLYGLPWVQGSRALFYNKELFRRAGLDPERPPETWSELLAAAKSVKQLGGGIEGFGLNMGERYVLYKKLMAFAWGNGGRIVQGDSAVFDSQANREALRFYLELSRYSLLEKQEILDHYFKEGKLGMEISGAWNLKEFADAPHLNYGVALVPRPDGESGFHASFAGAEILVVFRTSRQRQESIELARFLHAYPQAKRLSLQVGGVFPASRRALTDRDFIADPMTAVFVRQASTSRSAPAHPGWLEMEDVVNAAIERVLYGRAAPELALSEANAELKRILKTYRTREPSMAR